MPKAFVGGGWLVSAVFEVLSAVFSTYCVTKLVQVGLEHKIHSYQGIVEEAFGKRARSAFELTLSTAQLSFCLSYVSYIVKSSKTIADEAMNLDSNPWIYAAIIICILTPLTWVRNVADFSSAFLLANLATIWALVVVVYYCVPNVIGQEKFGPDI